MTRQTYDRAPRLTKLATAHISNGDTRIEQKPTIDTRIEQKPTIDTRIEQKPTIDTPIEQKPTIDTRIEQKPTIVHKLIFNGLLKQFVKVSFYQYSL